mgnify:FL=1
MATKKAASTKKGSRTAKHSVVVTPETTVKTVSSATAKQSFGEHVETALQSPSLWRALAAEFIGTFLLAAVVIAGQGQPIFMLFALVGIVLFIGSISGAHVNPAITIGAWATRRIGWLRAIGYLFVQFLGAAVAFFTLQAFIGGAPAVTEAQQAYGQTAPTLFQALDLSTIAGREWYVFFSELLGTAILGFAIANASRVKDSLTASFTAGFGLFIALMIAVTIGGFVAASAIINPAVALALQAYDPNGWTYIIYALAPVIGGVLGFVLYDLVRGKKA